MDKKILTTKQIPSIEDRKYSFKDHSVIVKLTKRFNKIQKNGYTWEDGTKLKITELESFSRFFTDASFYYSSMNNPMMRFGIYMMIGGGFLSLIGAIAPLLF